MIHKVLRGDYGRNYSVAVWLSTAALLVLMGGLVVWRIASPDPVFVMVATPAYQDIESSVATSGRVVPEHEFLARASVPGLIDGIDVQLGQHVVPGQLLVRMRDPYATTRLATARAALQSTEVGNDNMRRGGTQEERLTLQSDLDRAQAEDSAAKGALNTFLQLQESGAASAAEVTAARHRLDAAEQTLQFVNDRIAHRFSTQDVASWSARVAEARSNFTSAKASLAGTNITSPIAGTVYLIPITPNDFVGVGAELLRVADLQKLEVRANFDEADMGKLHEGAAVQIRWEGKPGRIWHGFVRHAPLAAVMSGVRSVGESIITVTDVKDDLPPNTIVTATVLFQQRPHVLSLPREALRTEGNADFVYRVSKGQLIRTPVEVGLVNLDHFEIRGGVGPADQVALHTVDDRPLFDRMQVQVRP